MLPFAGSADSAINDKDGPDCRSIPFRLARDVTFLIQDDLTRLLDLALRFGPAEAIARVARQHCVKVDRVRADWVALFRLLHDKRLVVSQATVRRRALPGHLRLWGLMTLAWLSLRLLGWALTIQLSRSVVINGGFE